MNKFQSRCQNHFLILHPKKYKPVLLFLFIILLLTAAVFHFLPAPASQKQTLSGSWREENSDASADMLLTIDESTITINDFSFAYELSLPHQEYPTRENPQGFVLDGGSMGTLAGLFFFEDGKLFLEIDSQMKVFVRE